MNERQDNMRKQNVRTDHYLSANPPANVPIQSYDLMCFKNELRHSNYCWYVQSNEDKEELHSQQF